MDAATQKEEQGRQNARIGVFRRLIRYAVPYWHWFLLAIILMLMIMAMELYRPAIIGNAIDTFEVGGSYDVIQQAALVYFLVLIGGFVCNFLQTWILQLMGQNIIYNIRQEVFEHIHKLSLRFFDITPVGRIVTRVTNDVEALNDMFANILVRLFKNLVKIVGIAVVMLRLDAHIAMYAFVLLPFIVALTVLFKTISKATYRLARTKLTAINTYLSEHLSGMKLIQIFAREREKNAEFVKKSRELYRANYREMLVFAIFRPSIYMLSILALVIIITAGGRQVLNGAISVGTLYIFINYIMIRFPRTFL